MHTQVRPFYPSPALVFRLKREPAAITPMGPASPNRRVQTSCGSWALQHVLVAPRTTSAQVIAKDTRRRRIRNGCDQQLVRPVVTGDKLRVTAENGSNRTPTAAVRPHREGKDGVYKQDVYDQIDSTVNANIPIQRCRLRDHRRQICGLDNASDRRHHHHSQVGTTGRHQRSCRRSQRQWRRASSYQPAVEKPGGNYFSGATRC